MAGEMDIDELRSRLAAGRKCEETVEGIVFSLVLPTPHAFRVAWEAARVDGDTQKAKVGREILEAAIVGWRGLEARHLTGEKGASAPVAFSPAARAILLDERQDYSDELAMKIYARMGERQEQYEAAEKNS